MRSMNAKIDALENGEMRGEMRSMNAKIDALENGIFVNCFLNTEPRRADWLLLSGNIFQLGIHAILQFSKEVSWLVFAHAANSVGPPLAFLVVFTIILFEKRRSRRRRGAGVPPP